MSFFFGEDCRFFGLNSENNGQEGNNFHFRDIHIPLAGAQPYTLDPIFGLLEGNS